MTNFESQVDKGSLIISAIKPLAKRDYEDILKSIENKKDENSLEEIERIIFDLPESSNDSSFLRLLAGTSRLVRDSDKDVYAVQSDPEASRFLNEQGLSITVTPTVSSILNNAKKKEKPVKTTNVEFITPFIQATGKVLSIQCEVDVTPGDPTVKMNKEKLPIDIAAVIGLHSNVFEGSIALCFPKDTFLKIMGNMMGEEFDEIDEELEDGAGELLNIIFGQAKIDLNEKNYGIDKAIPTVVRGEKIGVKHIVPNAATILPFESSVGPFYIEIAIK